MFGEKGMEFKIIKFFPIVALNGKDWQIEVSCDKSMKSNKSGKGVRFLFKGKTPEIMRKIINGNKVISIASRAGNRRGP